MDAYDKYVDDVVIPQALYAVVQFSDLKEDVQERIREHVKEYTKLDDEEIMLACNRTWVEWEIVINS